MFNNHSNEFFSSMIFVQVSLKKRLNEHFFPMKFPWTFHPNLPVPATCPGLLGVSLLGSDGRLRAKGASEVAGEAAGTDPVVFTVWNGENI